MNKYRISFSYWDYYPRDGITRLTCGPFRLIGYILQRLKCEIHIHKYNKRDGGGQIGRHVWNKYFNIEGGDAT